METTTMEPKMIELLQAQKTRVALLAREGVALRKQIHAARSKACYDLWVAKRAVGATARYALLAYAFLRGRPYRSVESQCRELHPDFHPDMLALVRKSMARRIMDGAIASP